MIESTPTKEQLIKLREECDPYGACMEAADELLHLFDKAQLLYVERADKASFRTPIHVNRWWYHAAIILNGKVFDPWMPEKALTLRKYLATVFARMHVVVTIDAVDVYSGPANEFKEG